MITLKINYYIHLLLNSKYRMFINLFIIFSIYLLLYNKHLTYCMNDNPNMTSVPAPAEAKVPHRPSHQVLALKREIMDYAGTQAQALFLEKMRVEEEIIALTTRDPDEILQALEQKKQNAIRVRNSFDNRSPQPVGVAHGVPLPRRVPVTPMSLVQIESYAGEKSLLSSALGSTKGSTPEKLDRIYYLIRMYRRLSNIS